MSKNTIPNIEVKTMEVTERLSGTFPDLINISKSSKDFARFRDIYKAVDEDKLFKGEKGDAGAQGATGATGAVGAKGADGEDGATGAQGPAGAAGATGATGAVGAKGADGEDGATGAQGPAGAVGPAGVDGAVGPAGAVGPDGDQGEQGEQGEKGDAGDALNLLNLFSSFISLPQLQLSTRISSNHHYSISSEFLKSDIKGASELANFKSQLENSGNWSTDLPTSFSDNIYLIFEYDSTHGIGNDDTRSGIAVDDDSLALEVGESKGEMYINLGNSFSHCMTHYEVKIIGIFVDTKDDSDTCEIKITDYDENDVYEPSEFKGGSSDSPHIFSTPFLLSNKLQHLFAKISLNSTGDKFHKVYLAVCINLKQEHIP